MTTSCLPRALRFLAIAVLTLTALGLRAASPATFDIPPQPAPAALKQFIKQSGTQVVYIQDDLKAVTTKAVKGDLNPAAALAQLLDGTGFAVETMANGNFTISRPVALKPGSIEGTIRDNDSGRAVAGARVAIAGTDLSVLSDKRGRFTFAEAPTGDHALEITADGIQNTRVTDVSVKTGHRLTLSTISVPVKSAGAVELDPYVVSAKKNDGVVELDPYSVEGRKEKPFTVNMDIPRTINDAQPYYIFDAKTIDTSGATNVEDFLKQRLTMNTVALTNKQDALSIFGNTSSINLRGVGTDKTLILVNGRRMAGVSYVNINNQPDLNGIPLSAIDRIEVLPSSASGIYGGSAIGGVVNVILKRDYSGGELRATYDNAWDSDAPRRTVSLSCGLPLEGGRTQLSLNLTWSDTKALLLQDRVDIFRRNVATIRENAPTFIGNGTSSAWLGVVPNILPSSANVATLTLKSGNTPLGSRITRIPAGTTATTPAADLAAGLLANAGQWNLEYPSTNQSPTGLFRALGSEPETRSFQASLRRQMLSKVELFAEMNYRENQTYASGGFLNSAPLVVPASSPTNPFTTAVRVQVPDASWSPRTTSSTNRSSTLGARVELPWSWIGNLDYTWSQNQFNYSYSAVDSTARAADLLSGVLNPFVDTLLHPLNLRKYAVPFSYRSSSRLDDLNARASGPLSTMPWGTPNLTIGFERRKTNTPEQTFRFENPITLAGSYEQKYYARESTTNSGYLEALVPLVKTAWVTGVHSLELQISGRAERYQLDAGTDYEMTFFNSIPPSTIYGSPTLNGLPYFAKAKYSSTNGTIGLKYQPMKELIIRVSRATAFLPPTPDQLLRNPQIDSVGDTVVDPRKGLSTDVQTVSGGNPDLKPQSSKSFNAGIVWEPTWKPLAGLRLNAEYYKIEQFRAIGSLSAQSIVTQEAVYPGRVVRDGSGVITEVDTSYVNLYRREAEGWDFSIEYSVETGAGRFSLHAVESIALHLTEQYSVNQPAYDSAGYHPTETGTGGTPKYKSNASLTWEKGGWTAGWSTRYISSYKQYGAPGGPTSLIGYDGEAAPPYIAPQGGETIASQVYHDLFAGYTFGQNAVAGNSQRSGVMTKTLSGLSIRLGIRNVFDRAAPFDAAYASNFYQSPFGDMQMRSYWLSLRKSF